MCSFGSCQTRFEFLSQFRKVRNTFECFVTQVQTHLPKTKRVWPMKINVICTVPIEYQMCCRFVNFFKSLVESDNALTQLCSKLVLSGSRSAICNRLTHVSALLKYNINDII